MIKQLSRKIILIVISILIIGAVIYGFLPETIPVQTGSVVYAPLQVIIEEEGETKVEELYVMYSNVAAFMRRIDFEPGDIVQKGQPMVYLEAPHSSILDSRSRAEATARIQAMEAILLQTREQMKGAEAIARRATDERRRIERLVATGSSSLQALEIAIAEHLKATADLEASQAAVAAAYADLQNAKASLQNGSNGEKNNTIREILYAPETGRILAVHRKSESYVNPGEALIEIGDINRLEVKVEVLSQDAVRIAPGTRVILDHWGGDTPVEAVVSHVEPLGSTVVSALGVEEQRVNVIAKFVSPQDIWTNLGSGYRVLARFVVWESDKVLQVPTSAMFRTKDGWNVFVIEHNRAVRKRITIGHQAGPATQVIEGLEEGDIVIVHPDSTIDQGTRIDPRWTEN